MNTAIPCRQPKVLTELTEDGYFHLTCQVPGCPWEYRAAVKVDAADQKRYHRLTHTTAIPATSISTFGADRPYLVDCSCGWNKADYYTVRKVDAEAARDHHLEIAHGLVKCP